MPTARACSSTTTDRRSRTTSGGCTSAPSGASARCQRSSNGTRSCPPSTCCSRKPTKRSADWRPRTLMPPLRELERRFAAALLDGDERAVVCDIEPDAPGASARLAVYRHHVLASLTAALASTFPVVRRLVDP